MLTIHQKSWDFNSISTSGLMSRSVFRGKAKGISSKPLHRFFRRALNKDGLGPRPLHISDFCRGGAVTAILNVRHDPHTLIFCVNCLLQPLILQNERLVAGLAHIFVIRVVNSG